MKTKFWRGFLIGFCLSAFFYKTCASVDHVVAEWLHAAHGGEEHDR